MNNVLPTGRRGLRISARAVSVSTVGAVLVAGGGLAYAAWSVTAAGSSAATSSTALAGVVSVATPVGTLHPGGTTSVAFTVTNPNSFPVTYTAADFGAIPVDNATLCPVSNVSITDQAVSIALAAGATSSVVTPAGAISMIAGAPDGCQGRTFTVATTLTGASG